MALLTVTLAGFMLIQAVRPADFDYRPVVNSATERSAEVGGAEGFPRPIGIERY